mmetsp:Transcript_501/g.1282  ORF Transcript_501/g.1282 Transcript_501/m.1282 type:complete len:152 (-) Transcript_501:288-743(-)
MDGELEIPSGGCFSFQAMGYLSASSACSTAHHLSLQTLQDCLNVKTEMSVSGANFVHTICIKLHWNLLCKNIALSILFLVLSGFAISSLERNFLSYSHSTTSARMHRTCILDLSCDCHLIFHLAGSTLDDSDTLRSAYTPTMGSNGIRESR